MLLAEGRVAGSSNYEICIHTPLQDPLCQLLGAVLVTARRCGFRPALVPRPEGYMRVHTQWLAAPIMISILCFGHSSAIPPPTQKALQDAASLSSSNDDGVTVFR